MGALSGNEYNVTWQSVDGDGPDADGNISNAKAWLKKVLYDQWDLTKQKFDGLSQAQQQRFCEETGIDASAFARNDRNAVDGALECLMDESEEQALKDFLTKMYSEEVIG